MSEQINVNAKIDIIDISDKRMTYDGAVKYCKKKGGRLPSSTELQIISVLQQRELINTNFDDYFWVQSTNSGYSANYVEMEFGKFGYTVRSNLYYVICVSKDSEVINK